MRFAGRVSWTFATACVLAGLPLLASTRQTPPPQTPPPASPPQQQPQPVFRGGVNLITVDAYPQRNGKIVPDLKASDFDVYEDGKLQKVETFNFVKIEPSPIAAERKDPNTVRESNALAADPANRVFVIFLDLYHVTVAGSHDIRKPLSDVLSQLMAPTDLFGIMTPLMRPRDLALGRVSFGIEEQLLKNWPWGIRDSIIRGPEDSLLEQCFTSDPDTGRPWIVNDGAAQRQLSDIMIARRREDATMTSVEDMMTYLGALREGRKSILLISTGWILYQRDDAILGQITTRRVAGLPAFQPCMQAAQTLLNIDGQQHMRSIIDRANRTNVTFYPVSPTGLETFDTPINESLGARYWHERIGPQGRTRSHTCAVVGRPHARGEHGRHRGRRHERPPRRPPARDGRHVGVLPARLLLDEHEDGRAVPEDRSESEDARRAGQGATRICRD